MGECGEGSVPVSPVCLPCPASLLSLQELCLWRLRVPVPQTRALQGPNARPRRAAAIPVGPWSPMAVPPSPAAMVLCVCPRVQGPVTSAAIVCPGSKARTVSWTSMSVRPGPAATGPPAATWPTATSVTAPLAMQVTAPGYPWRCHVSPIGASV